MMSDLEHPRDQRLTCSDELKIFIRYEGDCWMLECHPSFETLVYRSGGVAEHAARMIAARFARCGQGVHMVIEDRRHAVAGTKTYFPVSSSEISEHTDQRHWA